MPLRISIFSCLSLQPASYVQWTSPLRRFLDLEAHWQLKKWLLKVQAQEFAAAAAAAAASTAAVAQVEPRASGQSSGGARKAEQQRLLLLGGSRSSPSPGSPSAATPSPGSPHSWYYDPYALTDKASLHARLQERAKVSRHAAAVQRETTHYWLLEALRRPPPALTAHAARGPTSAAPRPRYGAVVLGPAPPSYASDHAVLLVDVGCELVLRGDDGPGLEPGSVVTLEVEACDPRAGTITLRRVR